MEDNFVGNLCVVFLARKHFGRFVRANGACFFQCV